MSFVKGFSSNSLKVTFYKRLWALKHGMESNLPLLPKCNKCALFILREFVSKCDREVFRYLWMSWHSTHMSVFQISLVLGALRLSRTILDKFPDMIAPHLTGRLLPEIRKYDLIRFEVQQIESSSNSQFVLHFSLKRSLLQQCDNEGLKHNVLMPLRHCLSSPGGPLKYSLEGHKFAIFGCSLTNDKRYVVSVSTR